MSRELNAKVAEKVMGWMLLSEGWWKDEATFAGWVTDDSRNNPSDFPIWCPKTDPRAMMEVLTHMAADGWRWVYDYRPDAGEEFAHVWRFVRGAEIYRAEEPTLMEAVSLAAIRAMDGK